MKILFIACITLLFSSSAMAQNHVALKSFTAKRVDCQALLEWTITNEASNNRYEIQWSTDSLNFTTTVTMAAHDDITAERKYSKSLLLIYPSNYFRLKIVSIDDRITYSKIIFLYSEKCDGLAPIVAQVKSNPVTGHNLAMTVVLAKADNLDIKMINMSGNLVSAYQIQAKEGKNEINFYLPVNAHGQYILTVFSKINGRVSKKIFVE